MMSSVTLLLPSLLLYIVLVRASSVAKPHVEEGIRAFKRQEFEILAPLDPIRKGKQRYPGAIEDSDLQISHQLRKSLHRLAYSDLHNCRRRNQPSDASFVSYTKVEAGQNAGGPPSEVAPVQGGTWEIDHLVELQFSVGAFSVERRPSSIPATAWTSASNAIFTKTPKNVPFAPQQTIASAISNLTNLEGIPKRVNGFKQQVFTGRIKDQNTVPSDRTYPTDFGKALKKLLLDKKQESFVVIGNIGDSLASAAGTTPVSEVKTYFISYAESIWTEADSFLDTWTGTSYPKPTS